MAAMVIVRSLGAVRLSTEYLKFITYFIGVVELFIYWSRSTLAE